MTIGTEQQRQQQQHHKKNKKKKPCTDQHMRVTFKMQGD